jgi:hypothetical protein
VTALTSHDFDAALLDAIEDLPPHLDELLDDVVVRVEQRRPPGRRPSPVAIVLYRHGALRAAGSVAELREHVQAELERALHAHARRDPPPQPVALAER